MLMAREVSEGGLLEVIDDVLDDVRSERLHSDN